MHDHIYYKIFDAAYAAMIGEGGDGSILLITRPDELIRINDIFTQWMEDTNVKFACNAMGDIYCYYNHQESINLTRLPRSNWNGQECMFEYIWEI